jgi:hypothetical protein
MSTRIQSNGESVLGIGEEMVMVSGGGWSEVGGGVGSCGSHAFLREFRMWAAVSLHLWGFRQPFWRSVLQSMQEQLCRGRWLVRERAVLMMLCVVTIRWFDSRQLVLMCCLKGLLV